tara:strand:- start:4231 stop:4836 length:606 start_codon:yes stop_codon:yes gene_type:complete
MNFLAHLHLAEPTPESQLGNLLGDFVKGYPWDDRFPRSIWQGIVEHRAVDAFTDQHVEWKLSRGLLPPHLRRFAGIVVDIYYDHFLYRHWDRFSESGSIGDFIRTVHRQLDSVLPLAPREASEVIQVMIEEEWLDSYGSLEGIELTLQRVSKRSPAIEPVFDAAAALRGQLHEMESHFLKFYPDLISHVKTMRDERIAGVR